MSNIEKVKKIVNEHRDEALQCLIEALQSPSPTGNEAPMGDTMLKWIEKIGIPVNVYEYMEGRPNIIAEWKGENPGKRFLFNGHLDVFPPSETKDTSYNPWSGEIRDGYVYGRGATDMKSGDCAALMAIKLLKEMGFEPTGSIVLNFVSDEENGGTYGVLSLLKDHLLDVDLGISMEPTNMDIIVGNGGVYPCQIIVYGDGGHSAAPISKDDKENKYGGEDAIKKGIKAINALYDLQKEVIDKKPASEFGASHLAVTNIHAGKVVNNYARRAEILIDRRYLPGETPETIDAEIINAMEKIKNEDPFFEYEYHPYYEPSTPAIETSEDSEIVRNLDEACMELFGEKPDHIRCNGGADVAYISEATGADLPWYGPGLWGTDAPKDAIATTAERVSIDNYLNCIQVYMLTLIKTMS